jgi:ElaB/YqjD/DUF883 family membrane-anchored ribosome-binding protein
MEQNTKQRLAADVNAVRAVAQTKAAAHATDSWVHEHPWTALGIAAGMAFLVGLVVNRK